MADRKQFMVETPLDEELADLIIASRAHPATEEELKEQRISFAYGNAMEREEITKDSVRQTSMQIRLRA